MNEVRVSVVIATCNRKDILGRTLERLIGHQRGVPEGSFEIIVADDSSDAATRTFVEACFPGVSYVRGPQRGPASNRNRGAEQAIGEWLAFIDDDCQPADDWMAALLREASDPTLGVIEGRIVVPDRHDSPFRRHVENLSGGNLWSGNLAVRRELFIRLGKFDEDFLEAGGEDMEFGERVRRSGVRTRFCPAATVIHPSHVVSWRYLFWRMFLTKWQLLFLLKTGKGVPASAPTWRALEFLIVDRTTALLRATWRAVAKSECRGRAAAFDVVASWIMFPMVLPYLVYWDLRFRRIIRARAEEVRASLVL